MRPGDGAEAPAFWDHLDELRAVLLKSLAAWTIASLLAFCFKDVLFRLLFAPTQSDFVLYRLLCRLAQATGRDGLCPGDIRVSFLNTDLTAQFMAHVWVSLAAGLLVALPLTVWWLYGFIAPALYRHERRYAVRLTCASLLLFAAGVALSYFLLFPLSFRFLAAYSVTDLVVNQISLSSYLSLFLVLTLLMGLLFQVPVLTWFLARMGLLRREQLRRYRRHVFVAILIVAAVITPTGDPFTLLLVTLPVYLLYELSIALIPRGSDSLPQPEPDPNLTRT
ncbi:MAG: twin-arginine translocase subunit TatC [Paludibacteraceae bacterium]|nr:twin-arginine translocase subunit TatC [Paludibacteraceae bacterium]